MSNSSSNALITETSPYLLQHARNPVDWHPWGEDALRKARTQNKPILLSIGYSACHWCHVMAHESFEDEATARLMNDLYVNIKVDREERPDLDKIYQTSHQLLTRRSGGWPLTMFLAPDDHTPFFGGTYFPIEPRFGMPAFKEILTRVSEFFVTHGSDIRRQNSSLVQALQSLEPQPGVLSPITSQPLKEARNGLGRAFERVHGGFGQAPKFPHPTNLERCLRCYAASSIEGRADKEALAMAEFTLRKMALGGLYDQLGGGFCRYSVDEYWMIPHFEKMLYDNGPLLSLCTEVWQLTGDPLFHRIATETAGWVMREMQAPDGGYYSTIDADSEGKEGKYYVWTPDEIEALLSEDEYKLAAARFGLTQPPNFEGEAWHLHVFVDGDALCEATGFDASTNDALLSSARGKLFDAREQRVRPGLDDKILTSWNGLMIKGMAASGRALGDARLVDSAYAAHDFVRERMWQDGRLLATCKGGRSHLAAYLDDYAFMIDAVLTLLQARWRDRTLEFAIALAEILIEHFEDGQDGGFYFTADDHETLMHRPKQLMDDAVPSGNGIAAYALARLGHLLGEPRYLEAAERTVRIAWESLSRVPYAHNSLLLAVEEYLCPPQTIVLRGTADQLQSWDARCAQHYAPLRMTYAIGNDAEDLPGLLAERTPRGDIVAYVCEGHQCGPPITDLAVLEEELAKTEVRWCCPIRC